MAIFSDSDRLQWVFDGQKVTAAIGKGRGLPCVVVKACGYHALVRSIAEAGRWKDWETWCHVSALFPELPAEVLTKCLAALNKEEPPDSVRNLEV